MANEWVTPELQERIEALPPKQAHAVLRIVQHVRIERKSLDQLLDGEGRICPRSTYYQRPKIDEETGRIVRPAGWHYDPAFQSVLQDATKAAGTWLTQQGIDALTLAMEAARLAAPAITHNMIGIATATGPQVDEEGETLTRGPEYRDMISAAKLVLDYATGPLPEAAKEVETTEAVDWWKAAAGEDPNV